MPSPPPLPSTRPSVPYWAVSPVKVVVLSTATLGLYDIYWFYRQWKQVKDYGGDDIWPIWRGIFAPIFAFPLFGEILDDARRLDERALVVPGFGLALAYLVLHLLHHLPDPYWLLSVLTVVPLAFAQVVVNRVVTAEDPAIEIERRLGFGSGVAVTLGVLVWGLIGLGLSVQEDILLEGEDLGDAEHTYLREAGYLGSDEDVLYFYSYGMWSIEEDGNMLTTGHVVSYSNAESPAYHESAAYADIYDVEVSPNEDPAYTDVYVTTSEGNTIYLILPSAHRYADTFVDCLRTEWRKHVPEGEERLFSGEEAKVTA